MVNKPSGPTSHDVVARLRRALGTRRIGHAGTLDPLAQGVLVVMVGQATKLAPFLSADAKSYRAVVWLGTATTTLDADGTLTAQAPLPTWFDDEPRARAGLDEALQAERARTAQQPPAHSAVKVAGQRAYARARAGQPLELEPRSVEVFDLELQRYRSVLEPGGATAHGELELVLRVSKGYYVRSLARDLGLRLGLPAHLRALVRTASGPFLLEQAVRLDAGPEALRRALIPLAAAAQMALPAAVLGESGLRRARLGQRLDVADFAKPPPPGRPSAWLEPSGELAAIGDLDERGQGRVRRGFGSR